MRTKPSTGVISGFHQVILDSNQTRANLPPTAISASELAQRIEAIRKTYDPNFLDALIVRVLGHIQDHNNPHQVKLSQMGVDVIDLIYQAWLDQGNTGTKNDFFAAFFQTAPLAAGSDITDPTSTKLITVAGVSTLINQHNTDPDAHADLLAILLPGTPPLGLPSVALDARLGPNALMSVSCASALTLLDPMGNLTSVAANTACVDYGTGVPAFPLWGPRTNQVYPANPTAAPSQQILGCSRSLSPVGTLKLAPNQQACCVLTESNSNGLHGYRAPIALTQGLEYTASAFVYPLSATGGVVFYLDTHPTLAIAVDFATQTLTTSNASVIGHLHPLPNGFWRIGLQFLAPVTESCNLVIAKSAPGFQLGTTPTYLGTSALMFGLFGVQVVAGPGLTPYLDTVNAPASHSGTQLSLAWTQTEAAMIALTYRRPNVLRASLQNLLSLAGGFRLSALVDQLVLQTQNSDSTQSYLASSGQMGLSTATAFAYNPSTLSFGTAGGAEQQTSWSGLATTTGPQTLVFGASSQPFEGLLERFVIYPIGASADELSFLVGASLNA